MAMHLLTEVFVESLTLPRRTAQSYAWEEPARSSLTYRLNIVYVYVYTLGREHARHAPREI